MITDTKTSVYDVFIASAQKWPDRDVLQVMPGTAQSYGIVAGSITYNQARNHIDELSGKFYNAGYKIGMRIALLLENRPDFFLIWLALNRLGVSVIPINPDLRAGELEYLIGHSEPSLIIAPESRHEELISAAISAGISLEVIGIGDTIPTPREDAIVAQLLDGEAQEAAVLYTSGTTGNPKGCVVANTYFLLTGSWYANVGGLASLSTDGERMITPLPAFHMNAMAYSFMAMISTGGCLIALDRFHPNSWWHDVAASGATCLHYLGVMPSMLIGADASENDKNHNIRFGFGAGVDPKLQAIFEDRFGFPLVEAWAMTETGAGAVIAASTGDRLVGQANLGKPASDVACRIIDDNDLDVGNNMSGELLVRRARGNPRYGFFSHYYKDPEATDKAWKGGWFHTGDIVRKDENGNIFFVDRKKNVIRRSGENISAVEVESVLMKHPDIQAIGITSVADTIRGEEVFACIKTDRSSEQLAMEITQWCLTQMAYYKAPGYIAFVAGLPLTSTQKIQRARLKKLATKLHNDRATITTAHLKKRQVV